MSESRSELQPLSTDSRATRLLAEPGGEPAPEQLSAVYDVPLELSAVLGRATMPVSQLLRLGRGAVVELDRKVGEPVEIYVNDRLVARGEVLVVEDRLAVTMTEIVRGEP